MQRVAAAGTTKTISINGKSNNNLEILKIDANIGNNAGHVNMVIDLPSIGIYAKI